MSSPTQRTLAWLRLNGFMVGSVEKWIPQTKQRVDLFGFIDLVAVHDDETGCLGIQATSASNMASRQDKILSLDSAHRWLKAGNRIWVVGWSKKGAAGQRKLWTPTTKIITREQFE